MEGLFCVCECGGSGNKLILFLYPFLEMLWNRDVNLGTAQSIRQNWCYLFVWKQLLNHPPKVIKAQCGFSLTFINKVQLDFAILMTNLTESMRPYIFRNFLVSLFYTKKTAPMILPSCLPMQILSQGCVYEAGNQNTAFEYYSEKVNLMLSPFFLSSSLEMEAFLIVVIPCNWSWWMRWNCILLDLST